MKYEANFGDALHLVGDHELLGNWEAQEGVKMAWAEGHFWKATQELPDNVTIRYKVVCVRHAGEAHWEAGDDRLLELDQQPVAVDMRWNSTHNGTITPLPTDSTLGNGTGAEGSPGNGDEEGTSASLGNGNGASENGNGASENGSGGSENGSGGSENVSGGRDKPRSLLGNVKRLLRSFAS